MEFWSVLFAHNTPKLHHSSLPNYAGIRIANYKRQTAQNAEFIKNAVPLAAFPKCFLDALCVDRSMTIDEWLDITEQFDVDGHEFYAGFVPLESDGELERIREKVAAQGRVIAMMCYSPDFTKPSPAEREEEIRKQKLVIEASAKLGVTYVRVLSGQQRPEVARHDGIKWASECINQLLPAAAEKQITLILENHYKDGPWVYPEFAQKMDVFLELLDHIDDSPWLGVNYDPSNAVVAGADPIKLLEAIKHRVVTMHASDRYLEGGSLDDLRRLDRDPNAGYANILKHGVIGQGLNDYDQIFAILKDAGFKGWVSIEDGMDPDTGIEHIAESAKFLRRKMKEYGLP